MTHSTPETQTLYVREGANYRVDTTDEMLSSLDAYLAQRCCRGCSLQSPTAVRNYLRLKLAGLEYEVFWMISVDSRHRVIAHDELFRGTIDGATVHPREVVREAVNRNAAAVLFVHNHPSGVCEPSQADELITRRLRSALDLMDIRVLDHLVVGADGVTSFAEKGLL